MTGLLHEKEFSRKTFVKGGGAMIVAFSLAGARLAGRAQAADDPFASNGVDQFLIDSWIAIHADNTASIKTGGIRQGTGSDTGLLMIAGEELNMEMSQLKFVIADTNITPDTGVHSGSTTIRYAGPGVRAAAASAAQVLLGLASTRLGVPTSQLSVSKGVVSGGGKSVTYGELIGDKLFNIRMPDSWNMGPPPVYQFVGGVQPGESPSKSPSAYTLVGTSPPRIDIPAIVTGQEVYIQNVVLPGMLHGRVVRPRGQGVYGFGAPIISIDESSISHLPDVRIVRRDNFLGVVAPHEYDAIQAAAQLKVKWADPPAVLSGGGDEFQAMRTLVSAGKSVRIYNPGPDSRVPVELDRGDVDAGLASAAHVVSGEYGFGTRSHSPIGPMCAVADVTAQGARIFNGTQGPYQDRPVIAAALGLPENRVHVTACSMGG